MKKPANSQSIRTRTDRAFTLVELIIVLAIIAVLMAMLLPALRLAREAAISAQCVARLHYIYLTLNNYALDNRDWMPTPSTPRASISPSGVPDPVWAQKLFLCGNSASIADAQGVVPMTQYYRLIDPYMPKMESFFYPSAAAYSGFYLKQLQINGIIYPYRGPTERNCFPYRGHPYGRINEDETLRGYTCAPADAWFAAVNPATGWLYGNKAPKRSLFTCASYDSPAGVPSYLHGSYLNQLSKHSLSVDGKVESFTPDQWLVRIYGDWP